MAAVKNKQLLWSIIAVLVALFLWETLGLAGMVDRFRPGK